MNAGFYFTPAAYEDLEGIWSYIHADNVAALTQSRMRYCEPVRRWHATRI
jgi:plasmid stabilization system protein ParE